MAPARGRSWYARPPDVHLVASLLRPGLDCMDGTFASAALGRTRASNDCSIAVGGKGRRRREALVRRAAAPCVLNRAPDRHLNAKVDDTHRRVVERIRT